MKPDELTKLLDERYEPVAPVAGCPAWRLDRGNLYVVREGHLFFLLNKRPEFTASRDASLAEYLDERPELLGGGGAKLMHDVVLPNLNKFFDAPLADRIASLDQRIADKERLVANYHDSITAYLMECPVERVPYEALAGKLLRAAQIARSLDHLREQRTDLALLTAA